MMAFKLDQGLNVGLIAFVYVLKEGYMVVKVDYVVALGIFLFAIKYSYGKNPVCRVLEQSPMSRYMKRVVGMRGRLRDQVQGAFVICESIFSFIL
jgi:hypothetical protein